MAITPDDLRQIRELFAGEAYEQIPADAFDLHHDAGDVTYDGPCGVQTERGLYACTWSAGSGRIVLEWPQDTPITVGELEGLRLDEPDDVTIDVVDDYGDTLVGGLPLYGAIEQACVDLLPGHTDGAWHVTAVCIWEGGST